MRMMCPVLNEKNRNLQFDRAEHFPGLLYKEFIGDEEFTYMYINFKESQQQSKGQKT